MKKAQMLLHDVNHDGCAPQKGARILVITEVNDGRVATIEVNIGLKDNKGEVMIPPSDKEKGWIFNDGTCCSRVAKEIAHNQEITVTHENGTALIKIEAHLTQSLGKGKKRKFVFESSYFISEENFVRFFEESV